MRILRSVASILMVVALGVLLGYGSFVFYHARTANGSDVTAPTPTPAATSTPEPNASATISFADLSAALPSGYALLEESPIRASSTLTETQVYSILATGSNRQYQRTDVRLYVTPTSTKSVASTLRSQLTTALHLTALVSTTGTTGSSSGTHLGSIPGTDSDSATYRQADGHRLEFHEKVVDSAYVALTRGSSDAVITLPGQVFDQFVSSLRTQTESGIEGSASPAASNLAPSPTGSTSGSSSSSLLLGRQPESTN